MSNVDIDFMALKKSHSVILPRLYMLSSGNSEQDNGVMLLEQLKRLPSDFPCMVQIREKHLGTTELLALTLKAVKTDLPAGTVLLINKHEDIALAAGLQGVHLAENESFAERITAVSSRLLKGCSVHSLSAAKIAENAGADYLLYGPVFDTPSKRIYGAPQGTENLRSICSATNLPVYAVGGITYYNALECLDAGAYGIAGISAFSDYANLVENIEQFYRVLSL